MTPNITTRSFSNDQLIFDQVFFENRYKIRGQKERTKTFVDIGAHGGFFSFAALSLGAKKVYAFEPYIDSFNALLANCYVHPFAGRFTPYQVGVYTYNIVGAFGAPKLIDDLFFDFAGIGLVQSSEPHYPCQCVTLHSLLRDYCFDEQIDVLKINIGYAEKEMLLASTEILHKNVVSICGEVTCNEAEFLDFKKQMGLAGFINCISEPMNAQGRVGFRMSQFSLEDNFIE